ncbi:hypothetical protein M0R45_008847 [Rubus argutus]|uniref:Uncharacterized protein n=1 Tax=Rubus argutus TaxID=59490 RepID=A0AAW1Y663_RUBAR
MEAERASSLLGSSAVDGECDAGDGGRAGRGRHGKGQRRAGMAVTASSASWWSCGYRRAARVRGGDEDQRRQHGGRTICSSEGDARLGLGGADDTWADRRRQGLGFATGRNGSDGVVGVVVVVGGGEEMGTADLKKIG